ncbi:S-layer homology domain-containing protein [Fusibacter sp. JL298sf-3]
MKKITSLVLASSVLAASWAMPTYAAEVPTYGTLLHDMKLIGGTDKGLEEDKTLTRAQMMVILDRLTVAEADVTLPEEPTFTDVPKTHWAYTAVEKAFAEGVTTGVGEGTFGAKQPITRKQLALFMARVLGYDTSAIDYKTAEDAVEELTGIRLLGPYSDSKNVTRGEVFDVMVQGLASKPVGSEKTLVEVLDLSEDAVELFVATKDKAGRFVERETASEPVSKAAEEVTVRYISGNYAKYLEKDIPEDKKAYVKEAIKIDEASKAFIDTYFKDGDKAVKVANDAVEVTLPNFYGIGFAFYESGFYQNVMNFMPRFRDDSVLMDISATEGGAYAGGGIKSVYKFPKVNGKTPYLINLSYGDGETVDEQLAFTLNASGDVDTLYGNTSYGYGISGVYTRP